MMSKVFFFFFSSFKRVDKMLSISFDTKNVNYGCTNTELVYSYLNKQQNKQRYRYVLEIEDVYIINRIVSILSVFTAV